ncbi:hypothetical protein J1605_006127 [Eschrichtius robustus]|uniref:Uncharacterized protein n=1 Tax=Eschrichtius robustus TaxID=9764 RepID=A0AB34H4A5_ESCRO|nr:hypothetical protein J1605_006127 [Eschrichtius robustus]
MVPGGELAGDVLADPPFLAQFTKPRGAQEPRAVARSAKETSCPSQTAGSQAQVSPGSSLCLQPPEKVQVSHCHHAQASKGEPDTERNQGPQPTTLAGFPANKHTNLPARCMSHLKSGSSRASLVAQWLRICLPTQGTRVRALVWEDPTCRGATGPVSHNY